MGCIACTGIVRVQKRDICDLHTEEPMKGLAFGSSPGNIAALLGDVAKFNVRVSALLSRFTRAGYRALSGVAGNNTASCNFPSSSYSS